MSDNKIRVDLQRLVEVVMRQTTYNAQEAEEKLRQFGMNPIDVVRDFMGVNVKAPKTDTVTKSLNQEIYRQIRQKLDVSSIDYLRKNPVDVQKVADHFAQQEGLRGDGV